MCVRCGLGRLCDPQECVSELLREQAEVCRRFRVDAAWQAAQRQQTEADRHKEEQEEQEEQDGEEGDEETLLPPRPTAAELAAMVYDSRALRRDATGMLPGCLLEGGEDGGGERQGSISRASCASFLDETQTAEGGQGAEAAAVEAKVRAVQSIVTS